jgi:hypothetical protein
VATGVDQKAGKMHNGNRRDLYHRGTKFHCTNAIKNVQKLREQQINLK